MRWLLLLSLCAGFPAGVHAQQPGDTVVTIIKRATPAQTILRCPTDSALLRRLAILQMQYQGLAALHAEEAKQLNRGRWQRSLVEVASVLTLVGVVVLLKRSGDRAPEPRLPGEEEDH